jgi:hypothetical protein
MEFVSNPVPLKVTVVAAEPCSTLAGVKAAITAVGLLTLKPTAAEAPPPGAGFAAVTALTELPPRLAAGKAAITSVPLTKVVANADPFQPMVDEETNPLPVISRVVAPAPAVMLDGEMALIAGTGLFTSNAT